MTALPSHSQPATVTARAWHNRLAAAGIMVIPTALLGLASFLRPDKSGMGTHTQLGLPPCGFYAATGWPCPTCGMTTAFTYAAHGHLVQSFLAQPAGAVLAVLSACVIIVAVHALIRGHSIEPLFRPLGRFPVVAAFAGLVMAAWAFKIVMVVHGVS